MNPVEETLDCRGLQCPEPILLLAKTARQLSGASTLWVHADDEAFPLDVKTWCKSTGAELLQMERTGDGFSAHIRLPIKHISGRPASRHEALAPRADTDTVIDCRGKQCPEPILDVARAARTVRGPMRVLSDDPAFPLDLRSWAKTSRATIESLITEGGLTTAVVRPAASPLALVEGRGMLSKPPSIAPRGLGDDAARVELDLRAVPTPKDLERRLAPLAITAAGMEVRLIVAAPEMAQVVLRWATGGHTVVSVAGAAPVELRVRIAAEAPATTTPRPTPAAKAGAAPGAATGGDLATESDVDADCALLVLHNDLEALLAAMLVANGAAAQGMRVVVYFTFWGLNLLRGDALDPRAPHERVSWLQRLFKWLMPKGPKRQPLGQMNFGGAGTFLLRRLMREQKLTDLPQLLARAEEQGVRFIACTMSMSVMGLTRADLAPRPNLELGGVSAFVGAARAAQMSLVF